MPKPSIGRIVHYQTYGTPGGEYQPEPLAAIVTGVKSCDPSLGREGCPHASLHVFYGNGTSDKTDVPYSDEPKPGHWSWPPRVDPGPVQDVPEQAEGERTHVLDEACWCQPEKVDVPPTLRHR